MDIIVNPPKPMEKKPEKKETGEYFDFPCRQCGKKMVKKYVYGYIDDPNRLSPREIPGGCCIEQVALSGNVRAVVWSRV